MGDWTLSPKPQRSYLEKDVPQPSQRGSTKLVAVELLSAPFPFTSCTGAEPVEGPDEMNEVTLQVSLVSHHWGLKAPQRLQRTCMAMPIGSQPWGGPSLPDRASR